MATEEAKLLAKYKQEQTETSSVSEGEMKRILAKEGLVPEDRPKPEEKAEPPKKASAVSRLIQGLMPALPKKEDMDKARKTNEYHDFVKLFQEKFGMGKPKQKEIDEAKRKLENKYKAFQEHSEELDKGDTNMALFKNVILLSNFLEIAERSYRCNE